VHLSNGVVLRVRDWPARLLSYLRRLSGAEYSTTFPPHEVPGWRQQFGSGDYPSKRRRGPGLLLLSDRGIAVNAGASELLATAAGAKAGCARGMWTCRGCGVGAGFDTTMWRVGDAGASAVGPYLARQFAESLEAGDGKRCARPLTQGC